MNRTSALSVPTAAPPLAVAAEHDREASRDRAQRRLPVSVMGLAERVEDRAAELADLDPPRLMGDRHGRDERSLGMRPERPGRPSAAACCSGARLALAQPPAGDEAGDEQ